MRPVIPVMPIFMFFSFILAENLVFVKGFLMNCSTWNNFVVSLRVLRQYFSFAFNIILLFVC